MESYRPTWPARAEITGAPGRAGRVPGDWPAVAAAINQRMAELDFSQNDLIRRSGISKCAVSEMRNNSAQRHRSPRTLEALSAALDWHPRHLAAVLAGDTPQRTGEPVVLSDADLSGRLASIEWHIRQLSDRLDDFDCLRYQLDQAIADLSSAVRGMAQR
jgi:DNA-binding Xre family transcriptional regulator